MPINGLMLTLSSDPELAAQAQAQINQHGKLEAGELQDRWLPLVADTADDRQARDVHSWLEQLPGVEQVGVILVGFDETNP